jgi:hypothetical protein
MTSAREYTSPRMKYTFGHFIEPVRGPGRARTAARRMPWSRDRAVGLQSAAPHSQLAELPSPTARATTRPERSSERQSYAGRLPARPRVVVTERRNVGLPEMIASAMVLLSKQGNVQARPPLQLPQASAGEG